MRTYSEEHFQEERAAIGRYIWSVDPTSIPTAFPGCCSLDGLVFFVDTAVEPPLVYRGWGPESRMLVKSEWLRERVIAEFTLKCLRGNGRG